MIIKGVCKCDIDLIQQFIKQEVNIKWLILSDYNTIALFCININRFKQSPSQGAAHLHSNTEVFRLWMNDSFLNKSSESMIKLPIHKDSHVLHSWMNQPFERIN